MILNFLLSFKFYLFNVPNIVEILHVRANSIKETALITIN